ncbi:hypothetical protein [Butyrivibrio sp. VCB2006]|uniref:hypothetical protein n=1 Tax=Butyrivibrio sp. VCB2006 TaxID=1280679 RepID=UPI0012DDDCA8|nr:hypothetical protein [Butyrivibrio sp. VCB2006]
MKNWAKPEVVSIRLENTETFDNAMTVERFVPTSAKRPATLKSERTDDEIILPS